MVVYPMGWQGSRVKFMFIYVEQSRYGDLLTRAMRSGKKWNSIGF